jgi:hypothetical protein
MAPTNYPPGVTGNEPQITGEDPGADVDPLVDLLLESIVRDGGLVIDGSGKPLPFLHWQVCQLVAGHGYAVLEDFAVSWGPELVAMHLRAIDEGTALDDFEVWFVLNMGPDERVAEMVDVLEHAAHKAVNWINREVGPSLTVWVDLDSRCLLTREVRTPL